MRGKAAIAYRTAMRGLLRLFFIFPVRRNRIMMSSNNDAAYYTCNPKYICEYLKHHEPGAYDIVWAFAEPENWRRIRGIRTVKVHSVRWLYELLTSRVVIYNRNPESYLPKRPGQLVINTWHAGGAYKKVGFENATLDSLDLWRARQINDYVDLFLTSSDAFTKSNIEGYRYKGQVMRSGMPRNDLFFRPAAVDRIRKRVRSRFGAREDSLVVLYAPTYRRNVTDPLALQIEFPFRSAARALKERFPDREPVFWERRHHQDFNRYDAEAGVRDVSTYPDMQELLAAADILITDYSSSIWDFALLGRPCFLYVPDLAEYETVDRGFFTPIEEWPGIVCRDDAELEDALRSLDEEQARRKAKEHLAALGSCEDGHASSRVAELIHRTVFGGP